MKEDLRFKIWKKNGFKINSRDIQTYENIRRRALTTLKNRHPEEYDKIIKAEIESHIKKKQEVAG